MQGAGVDANGSPQDKKPTHGATLPAFTEQRLLTGVLLTAAAIMAIDLLILTPISGVSPPWQRPTAVLSALALPILWIIHWTNQRGNIAWASRALVYLAFLLAWTLILWQYIGKGLLIPPPFAPMMAILLATAFLPWRMALIHAAIHTTGVVALLAWAGVSLELVAAAGTIYLAFSAILVAISGLLQRDRILIEQQAWSLQASQTELHAILENTPDAVLSIDTQYRIRTSNGPARHRYEAVHGQPLRPGMSILEALTPQAKSFFIQCAAHAMSGTSVRAETREFLSDGTRTMEVAFHAIQDENGQTQGIGVFARDVTKERQRRRELEKRLEETRLNLLNAAGHELNTPLTPILMQMHILESGRAGPLTPRQERSLQTIHRNLEALGSRIHDLLEVARANGEGLQIRRDPVDLVEIVVEAVKEFQQESGASLLFDGGNIDKLPILGDNERLTNVIRDLLGDANQNGSNHEPPRLHLHANDDHVTITVEDDRPHEGQQSLSALLDPLSNAAQHGHLQSLGLRLVHCRTVAEAHGGNLECIARYPDWGARLRLTLPLQTDPDLQDEPSPAQTRTTPPTRRHRSARPGHEASKQKRHNGEGDQDLPAARHRP